MLRIILKGVRGHLVRFILTACAVMLGVAFVAGTFVLRDSMSSALEGLLLRSTVGMDLSVAGKDSKAGDDSRASLPLDLAEKIRKVEGVKTAWPEYQGIAFMSGKDGTAVRMSDAPGFAFAYHADDPSFTVVQGRPPKGAREIAVESRTLELSKLKVGDNTKALIGSKLRDVTIVGEVKFGSMFGATAIMIDEPTAQAIYSPDKKVQSFTIRVEDGVNHQQVLERLRSLLPPQGEVRTKDQLVEEQKASFDSALQQITIFLLIFAAIALIVGAFIIFNTFAMVIASRARELALLRAVGASRRQLRSMLLGEAVVIGMLGSALGLGLGVLLAKVITWAMQVFGGLDIAGGTPVTITTVLISFAVGISVTVLSALLPARRASRVAPVEVLRGDTNVTPKGLLFRGLLGTFLAAAGAGAVGYALTRDETAWWVLLIGVLITLLGVLVAAPLLCAPFVVIITWPFRMLTNISGKLAHTNAMRVPRRTALTASALTISVTFIIGIAVITQSMKASILDAADREIKASYALTTGAAGYLPIPSQIAGQAAKIPGVQSLTPLSAIAVKPAEKDTEYVYAASGVGLADAIDITMRSGSTRALDEGRVIVSESFAKDNNLSNGSTFTAAVGTATDQKLTVGGVYKDSDVIDTSLYIGRALYEKTAPMMMRGDQLIMVTTAPNADQAAVRQALADLVKPLMVVSVQNKQEYIDSANSYIDMMLNMLYALLLLTILVSVLGVINTLALSIVERVREIGLLRAVGLRRKQLTGMVTIESIAVAVFGALLGTILGLLLGWTLQRGLVEDGITELAIPWGTLIIVQVVAVVVGVVAAVTPAIRAARFNILQAIATE